MSDDERIGAVSRAEWAALGFILALIAGEAVYLVAVYLWVC